MDSKIKLTGQSFKTLRALYGMTDSQFRLNIKRIRPQLDNMAGRTNYRLLSPKQVLLIINHLGEP